MCKKQSQKRLVTTTTYDFFHALNSFFLSKRLSANLTGEGSGLTLTAMILLFVGL